MAFDMKMALVIGVSVLGASALSALSKSVGGLGDEGRKSAGTFDGLGGKITSLAGRAVSVLGLAASFSALAKSGFQANSSLETSRLGIASLITAQADLVGAYGRTLKGTDALSAASSIAADQMQKLKIAGLQTAATTDQLTEAYQQAVGAGLNAGLKLDEIREITVGVTQAAGALGVPMQQLNQEVTSILAGTIDINSRVAKSLGISNEMVASWKEQGVLAKKLGERLQAFTVAGAEISKTWAATKSNMAEAFSELARVVTGGAFERVKSALNDALSGLFNLKDATVAQWLQPITDGMRRVFDALGGVAADAIGAAVGGARALADWLDRNRTAVADMGESLAEAGRQVLAIGRFAGEAAIAFGKWLVDIGVVNGVLRTGALLLAGFRDGATLIGASFASVGADIMEFVVKPLVGLKDLLSGKGWGGSAFYASLRDQIADTRREVAAIENDFANGKTAVAELMQRWESLGETEERVAQSAVKALDASIRVQARQAELSKDQKKLQDDLLRAKEKATLSATEFQIREAEREATKQREIAAGNADLLRGIDEELKAKIAKIKSDQAAETVKAERTVIDAVRDMSRERVSVEEAAAAKVADAWSEANTVKAGATDRNGMSTIFNTNSESDRWFRGEIDIFGNPRYADGGQIRGPGTGTSDSILARVSNGEFVMRAKAVERYGLGFMDAINRMALPHFATGGKVGGSGAAAASAIGGVVIENINVTANSPRQFVAELRQLLRTDPGLLSSGLSRAG